MRRLLLAVALLGIPAGAAFAQTIGGATAGVHSSSAVSAEPSLPRPLPMPPQDSATRRSMVPYLLIGALAGGVIGFLLEDDFHDDFCTPGPGVSCSSEYEGIGVVIGAGLGALAGWIVYVVTASQAPGSSPSAPRLR